MFATTGYEIFFRLNMNLNHVKQLGSNNLLYANVTVTVDTLVTRQLFPIFLRKPMPFKIFKWDLKSLLRAKYCSL